MRRFGNFIIERDHHSAVSAADYSNIAEEYARLQKAGKRVVLGTLPSRSGTKWLCDIFSAHPNATGRPEPHYDAAAFFRYITYNRLPIDTAGIMAVFKRGIIEQWEKGDIALVFSPYFSHGLKELYAELKPEKIIFAINDPEFTVQSIYNKGFFKEPYLRADSGKAAGYQPSLDGSWAYTFGRLVPNGSEYDEWVKLTRVGKIAWWGSMVTKAIHEQLAALPEGTTDIFDLSEADQNYSWYLRLADRYGLAPVLNEKAFLALKGIRFKKSDNAKHPWTPEERAEFEAHTKDWAALYAKLRPARN